MLVSTTVAGTARSLTKRSVISTAAVFALAPLLAIAQNPPRTVQKFVARTELVTVPVIVLNHGKHVTGLHKADFEIEEEGHPKTVATFEEVGLAQSAKPIAPPPGIYTNEIIADGPVTMTVILLDMINTPYLYQEEVKRRLLDYLQHSYRADRPTMLAILHRSGLQVVHDFTNDPAVLEALVRHLKKDMQHDSEADNVVQKDDTGTLLNQVDVAGEYEALEKEFLGDLSLRERYQKHIEDDDRETTLLQLRQLARSLSSVRGMKSLIWASAGVVLPPMIDTRSFDLLNEYEETLKLMNAATIVVTPVDTLLETDNPAFRGAMNQLPASNTLHLPLTPGTQRIQNFMDIAQRTGGDYCLMRRERDCFEKMADFTSHYYLLSYYAQPSERRQWRKLRVNVKGEKLEVRARSGYYSIGPTSDPGERRKSDIAEASIAPLDFRGLPISARWADSGRATNAKAEKLPAADGTYLEKRNKRSFQIGIAPGTLTVDEADHNHIRLNITVLAMDAKGKIVNDLTQQLDLHPTSEDLKRLRTQGFLYANSMEVPAATTRLRLIVCDNLSENIGTVSLPVPATAPASK